MWCIIKAVNVIAAEMAAFPMVRIASGGRDVHFEKAIVYQLEAKLKRFAAGQTQNTPSRDDVVELS